MWTFIASCIADHSSTYFICLHRPGLVSPGNLAEALVATLLDVEWLPPNSASGRMHAVRGCPRPCLSRLCRNTPATSSRSDCRSVNGTFRCKTTSPSVTITRLRKRRRGTTEIYDTSNLSTCQAVVQFKATNMNYLQKSSDVFPPVRISGMFTEDATDCCRQHCLASLKGTPILGQQCVAHGLECRGDATGLGRGLQGNT